MYIAKSILAFNFVFVVIVLKAVNTIYIVLNFILIVVSSCIFLMYYEVEFLAFVILLLYVGAILVLFLFIVMLLNLNSFISIKNTSLFFLDSNFMFIVIALKTILVLWSCHWYYFISLMNLDLNLYAGQSSIYHIGHSLLFVSLLSHHFCVLGVLGVILLVSMVGSIMLCKEKKI